MSTLPDITPSEKFPFRVRLGYFVMIEISCICWLAVGGLLMYILVSNLRKVRRRTFRPWSTIQYYVVSLLVWDLILATGHALDSRWFINAEITEGSYCSTQAVVRLLGDVGVALTTLAIAVHTFGVLAYRWDPRPRVAVAVIGVIVLFLILLVGISFAIHRGEDFYGRADYWCWITAGYSFERIAMEYFWLWLTAFISIIIYITLALVMKGTIVIKGLHIIYMKADQRVGRSVNRGGRDAIALQLLCYPAVYLTTIFPMSITRWVSYHKHLPFSAFAISAAMLSLSGIFNVALYLWTRPDAIPIFVNAEDVDEVEKTEADRMPKEIQGDGIDLEGLGGWEMPVRGAPGSVQTPDSEATTSW